MPKKPAVCLKTCLSQVQNKKCPSGHFFVCLVIARIVFSGFTDCAKNGIIKTNYNGSMPLGVRWKGRIRWFCVRRRVMNE